MTSITKRLAAATCMSLVACALGGAATALAQAPPAAPATSSSEKVDDAMLLTKIKADLLKSGRVDGLDVNVDVKDGKVTLSGWASNEGERTSAEDLAKSVAGVKSVDNKIQIKGK